VDIVKYELTLLFSRET